MATCSTAKELMLEKISISTIVYGFFVSLKSVWDSDRSILKGNYFSIRLLKYIGTFTSNTLNVSNSILHGNLKRTGIQCSWNKTGVICFPFRDGVTSRAAEFCTHCRRFVINRGISYDNELP